MRTKLTRRGAVVGALAAVSSLGAGVASATTPPTEPTETTDSSPTTSPTEPTAAADTPTTADAMTETSAADSSPVPAGEPTGPLCAAASGDAATDMATSDTATSDTATSDTTTSETTATAGTATSDTATSDTTATAGTADVAATAGSTAPTDATVTGGSMADSPVATAAGMNPLLTTLVTAIDAAGLADTLDSGGPFTVLAPIDSAFDKLDPATLEQVLDDPSGLLTTVLTYHVIPEQLSMTDLASGGSFVTAQGDEVTFEMRNDTLVVNDGAAAVQCADIPTANATVFLIDSVLSPPSLTPPSSGDSMTATTATATDGTEATTPATTSGGGATTPTTGAAATESTTPTTGS